MKKLLGIVVLGLLLSVNAYAMNFVCKNTQRPNAYAKFIMQVDKKNMEVITTIQNNEERAKEIGAHTRVYSYKQKIYEMDDAKIIFGATNLEMMEIMYKRQKYNERYDTTNPKWIKKWIKKNGPLDQKRLLITFYYKEDYAPMESRIFDKKNNSKDDISLIVCASEKSFQKSKLKEIKEASNQMKQEIEPLKLMCRNIGYSDGTEKFADCVKDLYLKKLDADNQSQTTTTAVPKKRIDPSVWDDLLDISKGMSEGKSFTESLGGIDSSSGSSSSNIQCFKSGERVSGTNKICSYNCMGSEVTRNISSTSLCALSINLN
jgi:hypothetical protein